MRLYLKPLRADDQIIDAINDFTPPELYKKLTACRYYQDRITHINGEPVYNVAVEIKDNHRLSSCVWYCLKDRRGRFYYPIQYAGVMINREAER